MADGSHGQHAHWRGNAPARSSQGKARPAHDPLSHEFVMLSKFSAMPDDAEKRRLKSEWLACTILQSPVSPSASSTTAALSNTSRVRADSRMNSGTSSSSSFSEGDQSGNSRDRALRTTKYLTMDDDDDNDDDDDGDSPNGESSGYSPLPWKHRSISKTNSKTPRRTLNDETPRGLPIPPHPREKLRYLELLFSAGSLASASTSTSTSTSTSPVNVRSKDEVSFRVKRHQKYFMLGLVQLKAGTTCFLHGRRCRIWVSDDGKQFLWLSSVQAAGGDGHGKNAFTLVDPFTVLFSAGKHEKPSFTLQGSNKDQRVGPFVMQDEQQLAQWAMTLASIRLSYYVESTTSPGGQLRKQEPKLHLWQAARVALFELHEHLPFYQAFDIIHGIMRRIQSETFTPWELPLALASTSKPKAV